MDVKNGNPKDIIGSDKLPLHLWPPTATAMGCLGCLEGMEKYGRSNWRVAGVRASIYFDACWRHMQAWFDAGEDIDPDSGLPHLAHALACIAIIVDAEAAGKLTDDRMVHGGYRKLVDQLTPHVKRLKEKYQDRSPKHYSKADSDASSAEPAEPTVQHQPQPEPMPVEQTLSYANCTCHRCQGVDPNPEQLSLPFHRI